MYTILDPDLEVCGVLDLDGNGCKFYDDTRSTKIADEQGKIWSDTLSLSVPYGTKEVEYMTQGYHILVEGDDGLFYCYRIYNWEDEAIGDIHVKNVQAINLLAYDLNHKIVPYKKIPGCDCQQAFSYILQQSGWTINDNDFFGGLKSLEFTYGQTAQYWLDQLTHTFEVEIRAYVEIYNGKVRQKFIDIVHELGVSEGRRFEYSHDLNGIKRIGDDSQLYTKLYVYGGADKNGKPISIASVNNGDAYLVDNDANDYYNGGDAYLEGYITNDSIKNPSGLLDWGKKQLEKYNHPHYMYEIDVANLGFTPGLGDHIRVVDFAMEPALTIDARVIQLDVSEANPYSNKVILGEFVEIVAVTPTDIWGLQAMASQAANKSKSYKVVQYTPDGVDFTDTTSTKRIIIRVYESKDDITAQLERSEFIWHKIDANGVHDEVWEAAHVGVGNVIEIGIECADSTIRCLVNDKLSDPIVFVEEPDFQFFCKLQNDPPSGYTDWNYSVAQYAQIDIVNGYIYWTQLYKGTQVTAADIDLVDSHTITRTDLNGMFIDRMICKYGGHGAHFGLEVINGVAWIYSPYYNPDLDQWWIVKYPYSADKILTINDASVVKLARYGSYVRVNEDIQNGYTLTTQGLRDKTIFNIYKKSSMDEGLPQLLYTMRSGDFGVTSDQTYQSACLDFPYLYFTYGGTAGTVANGDYPVMYCVDVRTGSLIYKLDYTFTYDIQPTDDHHEAETITYYYDGSTKYIVQGFAFAHEDPTYTRRNNMLYRAVERKRVDTV